MTTDIAAICPDCGGSLKYHHAAVKNGDGITRAVCKKKCHGWKVIIEIDRKHNHGKYKEEEDKP